MGMGLLSLILNMLAKFLLPIFMTPGIADLGILAKKNTSTRKPLIH